MVGGRRLEAQADFYARLWQTQNGLPNNIVQAITQTSDGYLWIGTREGLSRFDGEKFDLVFLSPQTTEPAINSLLASRNGSLWIGTDGHGIFHLIRGELQCCDVPGRNNDFNVYRICEGGNGTVWFETQYGVLRWENGQMIWQTEFGESQKLICADDTGKVWVLVDGNLMRADLPVATNYLAQSGLLPRMARGVYRDSEGVFWIGTDSSSGNVLLKIKDGTITKFEREKGPADFLR